MDEIAQRVRGAVMTSNSNHIMYVLRCDHVMMSAPTLLGPGMDVQCGECHVKVHVKGVHVYEWHAQCEVCKYGRWCGLSEVLAARIAGAHERVKMHRTHVKYERNPSATAELQRLRSAAAL